MTNTDTCVTNEYKCRSKILKQNPAKPTIARKPKRVATQPGPLSYDQPQIFGGKGFSKIKRAPAYSFGNRIDNNAPKPAIKLNAPLLNVSGFTSRGTKNITHSVITPKRETAAPYSNPAPNTYALSNTVMKRAPAYSIKRKPEPPNENDKDQWTPGPNTYHPPMFKKAAPAYSLGPAVREPIDRTIVPAPSTPNFNYVKRTKPAFSLGYPLRNPPKMKTPGPNAYCERKFKYVKRWNPSPSFGIRHSPIRGREQFHLLPANLECI